jgi:uncharacterized RDD family membrane protein YckC
MQKVVASDRHAGIVSRAIAFLMDTIAISVTVLVVATLLQSVESFFMLFKVPALVAPLHAVLVGATIAFSFLFPVAYPIGFWALVGQTPGKALLGLRIVRMDGRRMTLSAALLRYLGYWVSAIPLFLGFAWILFDADRRGWHDRIAGTYVAYVRRVDPRSNRDQGEGLPALQ